jgi:hypothetical protein
MPAVDVITVLDLSQGGLAMRLQPEVAVGDMIQLELWSRSCRAFTVPATIVHAMRVNDGPHGAHYFAGVKFVKTGAAIKSAPNHATCN